jgi:hypothetical protein
VDTKEQERQKETFIKAMMLRIPLIKAAIEMEEMDKEWDKEYDTTNSK